MISFKTLCEKAAAALPALVILALVCFWGAALPRSAHSQTQTCMDRVENTIQCCNPIVSVGTFLFAAA